ncbi:MAG: DUF3253 domain-containing protein [Jannaschia sp.]
MEQVVSDRAIATALREMAERRSPATFCPSEIARALASDWRPLMPRIRAIAVGLPEIRATQAGEEIAADSARGPIRLSLRGDASGEEKSRD